MKHLVLSTLITAGVVAGAASAQSIADQVIPELQSQGYSRIEVKNGLNQVKVEAIRGNRELEIIYDARTGAILKQEVNAVRPGDDTAPGIEVRNERRDFIRDRNNDDDDPGIGGNGDRFDDDDDDDGKGRGRGRGRGGDRVDDDDDDDGKGRGRGRGRGGDRDDDDRDDRDDDDDDDDDRDDDDDDDDDDD